MVLLKRFILKNEIKNYENRIFICSYNQIYFVELKKNQKKINNI